MFRYAFNTTSARMRLTTTRALTTVPILNSKTCVGQNLKQADPVGPKMYKTVKEKRCNDKAVRRNQLIWLVKHSLGKEAGVAMVSPHELPWASNDAVKEEKNDGARPGVTVWPHLWLLSVQLG
jgi:hypothetical protein